MKKIFNYFLVKVNPFYPLPTKMDHNHSAQMRAKSTLWFLKLIEQEQKNFFYWAPVFLGTGIGLYFLLNAHSLSGNPLTNKGLLSLTLITALLVAYTLYKGWFWCHKAAMIMLLVSFGMALMAWRIESLSTPMLDKDIGFQNFEGQIEKIEIMPTYTRLTLNHVRFYTFLGPKRTTPTKVRLAARGRLQPNHQIRPGMHVSASAFLRAPKGPVLPGAYHFKRSAFFLGIGAVGFLVSPLKLKQSVVQSKPNAWAVINAWIAKQRHHLTGYLRRTIPGENGALVAALVTGDRSGITSTTRQAYIDSGLAHILAISGLHLSLVAGLVFFAIRGTLSLIPPLALRVNTKKISAGAAIGFTFAYLVLSGYAIPAQRAFIMTFVILFAVLVDRLALTMRNVALAALIVLILTPEALISVSFQLSFAAVIALVAVYEALPKGLLQSAHDDISLIKRLGIYLSGLVLTSMIATLATTPLTIFTFNRSSLTAVITNLVVIPILSFLIMPLLIMTLLTAPLTMPLFSPLISQLIEILNIVAFYVQRLPGSVVLVPQVPFSAQMTIIMGMLWVALWRTQIRYAGLSAIIIGILLSYTTERPFVYVPPERGFIGIIDDRGQGWVTNLQKERYARQAWMQAMGLAHSHKITETQQPFFKHPKNKAEILNYVHQLIQTNHTQGVGFYLYENQIPFPCIP